MMAPVFAFALGLALSSGLVGDAATPRAEPCVGYLVTGAGTAAVNGCYKPALKPVCEGIPVGFVLDARHELYEWKGTWRLGKCGAPHAAVFYAATARSALPPETAGATLRDPSGCGGSWKADDGAGHCPAVNRSGLPPAPTPAPPAPKPQPPPPSPSPPPMRLVFSDEFNGAEVNATRWNVLDSEACSNRSSAAHPAYCASNVFTEHGSLVLRVVKRTHTANGSTVHFACGGAVNTAKRFYQRQGRWEASVRLPLVAEGAGYDLHSAIWLTARASDSAPSGPITPPNISDCPQEIDIVEQYVGGHSPQSTALAHVNAWAGGLTSPEHDHCA